MTRNPALIALAGLLALSLHIGTAIAHDRPAPPGDVRAPSAASILATIPAHTSTPTTDRYMGIRGRETQWAIVNLAQLARQPAFDQPVKPVVMPYLSIPGDLPVTRSTGVPARPAPAVASGPLPAPLSPAPATSFLALADNNTAIPPDTHGAVGPNHLMVTLNTQVRMQDRSGGTLLTATLNQFWNAVGGGSGAFDPKVLYDPYAGRWIFVTCDDARGATSALLVGASQTSDPTGGWYLNRIDGDPDNLAWVDYPSLGFNANWIVVQVNMFNISNCSLAKSG